MILEKEVRKTNSSVHITLILIDTYYVSGRRMQWQATPVLLPGKSHGRRSLVGCSPWGHWGSDTTELLHFHFSLSCIGEGNGNPLQCSCLENTSDGGAWWAAIYGVAQSWTRLKRLSSSSSSSWWNPREHPRASALRGQVPTSETLLPRTVATGLMWL